MQEMVDTIRQIARHEADQRWTSALAVVTSGHGGDGDRDYACTVKLRETEMVMPKVPIATGLTGVAALPREGDLVLVLFVGGDLHAPVVVGRLYNEEVRPPENAPGELVVSLPGDEGADDRRLHLAVRTPGDGTRSVTLTLAGSVEVKVVMDDEHVQIRAGEAELALSQTGGSNAKAEVTVGGASIVLQSGEVSIKAEKKVSIKAGQVEISGDTTVKVAGQTIDLN